MGALLILINYLISWAMVAALILLIYAIQYLPIHP